MGENRRRDKFVSLAEKRVTRAIKDLRLIGNLFNKTNYSYTEQDIRQIISALEKEIKSLKRRFESQKESQEIVFKLE